MHRSQNYCNLVCKMLPCLYSITLNMHNTGVVLNFTTHYLLIDGPHSRGDVMQALSSHVSFRNAYQFMRLSFACLERKFPSAYKLTFTKQTDDLYKINVVKLHKHPHFLSASKILGLIYFIFKQPNIVNIYLLNIRF